MNLCLIKLKVRLFEGMLFDYLFYILNIAKIILKRSAYILTFHPRIEKSNLFILFKFFTDHFYTFSPVHRRSFYIYGRRDKKCK